MVASDRDGFFHPLVVPEAYVQKGMRIGYATDVFGEKIADFTAPVTGVVIYIRAVPSLKKGDNVAVHRRGRGRPIEVMSDRRSQFVTCQHASSATLVGGAAGSHVLLNYFVSAARVERRVFARLSFGRLRMIGSIIQPSPVGTSRVSEIASHSSQTPPSRSSNRQ